LARIRYYKCEIPNDYLNIIIESTGMKHIDGLSISFIVSKGSRTRAYARIYGLPKSIQVGHGLEPLYTIEFICEKITRLKNAREFPIIFMHELLHIPYTRSGGLRAHGPLVNNRLAKKISRKLDDHFWMEIFSIVKKCCMKL
jgi:predicted metallopeptidase